ncbi:hypothetical protein Tco_1378063 [Tanacetum coccineum]
MSGILPPILPPLGIGVGIPSSPNANRVDTMPNTYPTNTTTPNVARNVVEENNDNLPQLLDSRGCFHVKNVPAFDKDDFTSWKIRFLVFLDGLEPYLITTLEDGPFVPMSNLSTPTNPLPKCQNQWSNAKSRLTNQDKRLKSIIIVCLPNDVIKSIIKYKFVKEMWIELCLAYEGPSDTRDTKIAALRLKFNAFKALEVCVLVKIQLRFVLTSRGLHFANGVLVLLVLPRTAFGVAFCPKFEGPYHYEEGLIDDIYASETQRFTIQASSLKALISNNLSQDNDSDVKEDNKTSNEFMVELKAEYHERALWQIRRGSIKDLRGENDKGKGDKGKSNKGLVAYSFDWDVESVSSDDEGTTKFKAFMAIVENEPSVGKGDALSGQWVEITMKKDFALYNKVTPYQLLSEQIPGNIVKALGGKGRRKEKNSPKEVPLPTLPKLIGIEPSDASKILVSLSNLTANMDESNKDHTDDCEFYPGYEICGSIAHEIADCPKNLRNSLPKEESGPKVVFGDNYSGDTEGYGSVNCNGITFTRVAYVNGLKHNLISISELCDANFKVLFTRTQGTIYNQKDEVVFIAHRRRDVYVIDMSSYNTDNDACFYAKASLSVNWL